MTGTTIIKGAGTLVPAFEQISPGNVDKTSNPNLTVTRLQVLDKSELADYEILRLFNEPYFSYLTRTVSVWIGESFIATRCPGVSQRGARAW